MSTIAGHTVSRSTLIDSGNNEKLLCYAAGDSVVAATSDGDTLAKIPTEKPSAIRVHKTEPLIAVCSNRSTIHVLEPSIAGMRKSFSLPGPCSFLTFLEDRDKIVVSIEGEECSKLQFWCVSEGSLLGSKDCNGRATALCALERECVAFCTKDGVFVTSEKDGEIHRCQRIPELDTAQFVSIVQDKENVLALTSGGFLVCYSTSGTLKKWMDCKVCPSTDLLVCGEYVVIVGATIRFFKTSTWEFAGKLRLEAHQQVSMSYLTGLQQALPVGAASISNTIHLLFGCGEWRRIIYSRVMKDNRLPLKEERLFSPIEPNATHVSEWKGSLILAAGGSTMILKHDREMQKAEVGHVTSLCVVDDYLVCVVDNCVRLFSCSTLVKKASCPIAACQAVRNLNKNTFVCWLQDNNLAFFSIEEDPSPAVVPVSKRTISFNDVMDVLVALETLFAIRPNSVENMTLSTSIDVPAVITDAASTGRVLVLLCGSSLLFCEPETSNFFEVPLLFQPTGVSASATVTVVFSLTEAQVFSSTTRGTIHHHQTAGITRVFAGPESFVVVNDNTIEKVDVISNVEKGASPSPRRRRQTNAAQREALQKRFEELDNLLHQKKDEPPCVHSSGVLFANKASKWTNEEPKLAQHSDSDDERTDTESCGDKAVSHVKAVIKEENETPQAQAQDDTEVTNSVALAELNAKRAALNVTEETPTTSRETTPSRPEVETREIETQTEQHEDGNDLRKSIDSLKKSIAVAKSSRSQVNQSEELIGELAGAIDDLLGAIDPSSSLDTSALHVALLRSQMLEIRNQNRSVLEQNAKILERLDAK